jgi:hypothetical protein
MYYPEKNSFSPVSVRTDGADSAGSTGSMVEVSRTPLFHSVWLARTGSGMGRRSDFYQIGVRAQTSENPRGLIPPTGGGTICYRAPIACRAGIRTGVRQMK